MYSVNILLEISNIFHKHICVQIFVSQKITLLAREGMPYTTIRIWIYQCNPPIRWCTPTGLQYSTIEQKATNWQMFSISSHFIFSSFGSHFVRIFPSYYCAVLWSFVIPQRLLGGHQRPGETWRLHFQTDFHSEDWGSSVLRNVGNHLSFGAVPLKNIMDCHSLRSTSLQHSISSFPLNFIPTFYEKTSPTQDEIFFSNSVHKCPCE
jgi:hypothetical protein